MFSGAAASRGCLVGLIWWIGLVFMVWVIYGDVWVCGLLVVGTWCWWSSISLLFRDMLRSASGRSGFLSIFVECRFGLESRLDWLAFERALLGC